MSCPSAASHLDEWQENLTFVLSTGTRVSGYFLPEDTEWRVWTCKCRHMAVLSLTTKNFFWVLNVEHWLNATFSEVHLTFPLHHLRKQKEINRNILPLFPQSQHSPWVTALPQRTGKLRLGDWGKPTPQDHQPLKGWLPLALSASWTVENDIVAVNKDTQAKRNARQS